MPIVAASLLAACALAGAWLDVVSRRLPNWLCLVTALAGLTIASFSEGLGGVVSPAIHAGVALLAGMALFRFGLIGGGDAKFYAACAAWFPLSSAPQLLVAVSLAGLAVVAAWWGYRRVARAPAHRGGGDFAKVPYGLAVAVGAVALKAYAP